MASELSGKKIAFLVAQEGIEEVELTKRRGRQWDEGLIAA